MLLPIYKLAYMTGLALLQWAKTRIDRCRKRDLRWLVKAADSPQECWNDLHASAIEGGVPFDIRQIMFDELCEVALDLGLRPPLFEESA